MWTWPYEVTEREKKRLLNDVKEWMKDPRREIPDVRWLEKVTHDFACIKIWVDEIISSTPPEKVIRVVEEIKKDPDRFNTGLRPYILSGLIDRILKEYGRFEIPVEGNWSGLSITVPPGSELRIPEVKYLDITNYGKIRARRIDDLNIYNSGNVEVGEIDRLSHEGPGELSADHIRYVERLSGTLAAKEIDRLNLTSLYGKSLVVSKKIGKVFIHHTTDSKIITEDVEDIINLGGKPNYQPRLTVIAGRVGNFDTFPGSIYRGFEKLV